MPSLKHIKRRITSVRSTKKITKAMNLVATAKLQKTKARLNVSRAMFNEAARIMQELQGNPRAISSVFAGAGREVNTRAYIVMTSDRGLCGGYNSNIIKAALTHMEQDGKAEKVIGLGGRGISYFTRRGKDILLRYPGILETAFYEDAELIARRLLASYLVGECDEIYVAYTHFTSTISHEPRVAKLLPVDVAGDDVVINPSTEMMYESGPAYFMDKAMLAYLSMFIYGAMIEAVVCEQAARMMSMDSASKNADDIIEDLTLNYNRSRQGIITQEINEIVSGANALK